MSDFARPVRIRILAIDLIEFLGRCFVILLGIEQVEPLVIELVGRIVGDEVLVLVECAATGKWREQHDQRHNAEQRTQPIKSGGCS